MIDTGAAGVTDTGLGLAGIIGGAFGGEFSAGPVETGGGAVQLEGGGGTGAETDRAYAGPITVVGTIPAREPLVCLIPEGCGPRTPTGVITEPFPASAPSNPLQGILTPITGAVGGAGRQFGQGTLGTTYRVGTAAAKANPLRTLAIIALLGAVAYILYKRYYKKGD